MQPASSMAYRLLHEGTLTLADIESNGIRIDVEYLKNALVSTGERIKELKRELRGDPVYSMWRRAFGEDMNLESSDQLRHMLYTEMEFPVKFRSKKQQPSVNESALESIDLPFLKGFREIRKLLKIRNTFLTGIERNTIGDRLHPNFGLHVTATYRSNSSDPNFQNFPIRDKFAAEIVRKCFIPSKNCVLIESDYSGIEVRIAACYHKDPTMLKYISDPTRDMHRDMAAQIYMLEESQVTKEIRHMAKNKYVFPEFYGDYYINCARNMWEAIDRYHLITADGKDLKEHLAEKGITRQGRCDPDRKDIQPHSFEKHMKAVEQHFWGTRFSVYNGWKERWYRQYLKEGGFNTLTGFRIDGQMSRNDVINYPVQGSAFHCLLWSLIQVNKWLKKNKMKSRLVGQIHDSMIGDVHKREVGDYLHHVNRIMVEEMRKHFDWIITPIEVDHEVADTNWYEKESMVSPT